MAAPCLHPTIDFCCPPTSYRSEASFFLSLLAFPRWSASKLHCNFQLLLQIHLIYASITIKFAGFSSSSPYKEYGGSSIIRFMISFIFTQETTTQFIENSPRSSHWLPQLSSSRILPAAHIGSLSSVHQGFSPQLTLAPLSSVHQGFSPSAHIFPWLGLKLLWVFEWLEAPLLLLLQQLTQFPDSSSSPLLLPPALPPPPHPCRSLERFLCRPYSSCGLLPH
ncbi:hypothetical protein CRG98_026914 [Punica granatum]|uniref:Uncharacterized protein n=1 Tax=Punica granatum TaxID=22663 RepID=A0A2I0J8W8_PUNGR|nr:hypothetical protein CRG98_026914 [Punica granatum]